MAVDPCYILGMVNPFDAVTAIWQVRNQSHSSKILTADLASLFLN